MEEIKLGKCCGCQRQGQLVRNIISLPYKRPSDYGSGWGCLICDLHNEGAIAVLCDDCLEINRIDYVVDGYAEENKRIPYDDEFKFNAESFQHNMALHDNLN